jgi:hypothetical protein
MTLIKNDNYCTQPNNNYQCNTYRDSSQQIDTNHNVTKPDYSQENDIQFNNKQHDDTQHISITANILVQIIIVHVITKIKNMAFNILTPSILVLDLINASIFPQILMILRISIVSKMTFNIITLCIMTLNISVQQHPVYWHKLQ